MADVQKVLKNKTDDLMNREINRAEFLRYTGVALLSLVGVHSFIKNLHDSIPKKGSKVAKKSGYGGGAYGV